VGGRFGEIEKEERERDGGGAGGSGACARRTESSPDRPACRGGAADGLIRLEWRRADEGSSGGGCRAAMAAAEARRRSAVWALLPLLLRLLHPAALVLANTEGAVRRCARLALPALLALLLLTPPAAELARLPLGCFRELCLLPRDLLQIGGLV
jgi:hypothetical protein